MAIAALNGGGMISGATRGRGGPDLAKHLADRRPRPHNEKATLGESRSILSEDIESAVIELTRITSHSRSKKPIYHVHLDPEYLISLEQRCRYWDLFEAEFNLDQQPFLEAVHIRHGREHYHRAYSLVKSDGNVIPMPHDYARREKLGRIAEAEFGGRHVLGRHNRSVVSALRTEGRHDVAASIEAAGLTSAPRPVAQITPTQRYQAERTGIDPTEIRIRAFDVWSKLDPQDDPVSCFAAAELRLCQGKMGPILVDRAGGKHGLASAISKESYARGSRVLASEVNRRLALAKLPMYNETGVYDGRYSAAGKPPGADELFLDSEDHFGSARWKFDKRRTEAREQNDETRGPAWLDDDRRVNALFAAEHRRSEEFVATAHDAPERGEERPWQNTHLHGEYRAFEPGDTEIADSSPGAVGRTRIEDSRINYLTSEVEFSSRLNSLVLMYEMLDPFAAIHHCAEDFRLNSLLLEPEFISKINVVRKVVQTFIRLASAAVSSLIGDRQHIGVQGSQQASAAALLKAGTYVFGPKLG
jgi:hypothetical protein